MERRFGNFSAFPSLSPSLDFGDNGGEHLSPPLDADIFSDFELQGVISFSHFLWHMVGLEGFCRCGGVEGRYGFLSIPPFLYSLHQFWRCRENYLHLIYTCLVLPSILSCESFVYFFFSLCKFV